MKTAAGLRWRHVYREVELYKAAVRVFTKPLFHWRKVLSFSADGRTLYEPAGRGIALVIVVGCTVAVVLSDKQTTEIGGYDQIVQNREIGKSPDVVRKVAWNPSGSSVAGLTLPPEIHAVTVRGVTAHFGGEKPPVAVDAPLDFGVQALWFTFDGDSRSYLFKPKGELFFSDWSFDLFSPDGAHVLLLQDHYGPYHVVATDRLRDYLMGRAKPNYVVTRRGRPTDPAKVHRDGHWLSAREIQFTVACCGSRETIIYRLGQKKH